MTPESPGLLADKVLLVTGASRGIGAAAARLFAAEGASVVLAARRESTLRPVLDDIVAAGGSADLVEYDAAQPDAAEAAVEQALTTFGRLDGAFNNAATNQVPAPVDDLTPVDLDAVYAATLRGVWLAVAAEVRAIRASSGVGSIVNTSSIGSLRSNPALPAYGALKRAVNALTESAAATYGPEGIRVNAVAPGTTSTEMLADWEARSPGVVASLNAATPLRRAAEPTEIAEAAAWLLGDRASYVTGVVLPVDGGLSA